MVIETTWIKEWELERECEKKGVIYFNNKAKSRKESKIIYKGI